MIYRKIAEYFQGEAWKFDLFGIVCALAFAVALALIELARYW